MTRSLPFASLIAFALLFAGPRVFSGTNPAQSDETGTFPVDSKGRPLNLGFETGTLADWTAEGTAFRGQPDRGRHRQPAARGHAEPSRGPVLGRLL